jgi:hypothetical protein
MTQIRHLELRQESSDRYVVYLCALAAVGGLSLAMLQMVLPVLQLGVPAVIVWGLFRYLRNAQGQLQRRLNTCFYQLLQQNQGRVLTLDFAMMAHLSAAASRKFLDEKAREFSAQFEVTECGEVVYLFPRMNLQPGLNPDAAAIEASSEAEAAIIQEAFDQLLAKHHRQSVPADLLESTQAFIFDAALDSPELKDDEPEVLETTAPNNSLDIKCSDSQLAHPPIFHIADPWINEAASGPALTAEPEAASPEPVAVETLPGVAVKPDLALEDLALEDLALEDLALEDLAIKDLALEDLALEAAPVENLTVENLTVEDWLSPLQPVARPQTLTQTALAKRLGVSTSTLSRRKTLADLEDWSQTKDPEGIAWQYLSTEQCFSPAPDF